MEKEIVKKKISHQSDCLNVSFLQLLRRLNILTSYERMTMTSHATAEVHIFGSLFYYQRDPRKIRGIQDTGSLRHKVTLGKGFPKLQRKFVLKILHTLSSIFNNYTE